MILEELDDAAGWLRTARRVAVFTGAGVSAESGIPTFRDGGGLWREFPPEEFASWRGLLSAAATSPGKLARFLLALLEPIATARPNSAHTAIAEIEKYTRVTIITQNVDGLHQEAGSREVLQIHGTLLEIVDSHGQPVRTLTRADLLEMVRRLHRAADRPAAALSLPWAIRPMAGLRPTGAYKPRIVLFGDAMAEPDWSAAMEAADECDCFLSVGTSGQVMPAAMLPSRARIAGAPVIEIGPEPCLGDIQLRGHAGSLLPQLVQAAFHQVD